MDKDFSLHLLELVINSINALASNIIVTITTAPLTLKIVDNGTSIMKTYDNELIGTDHGLGHFSFFMHDKGSYTIEPLENGTKVSAKFDRKIPLGDLKATILTSFMTNREVAIRYEIDKKIYQLEKDKSNLQENIKELLNENS
ncbi:MAG: hypothetical protein PHI41_01530 [Erysipelotrichaceae bacterium]|nr:hypothetical protein [Erysipelotrichaceae bacterium]MDD3808787.1 hypothetical protein [Erysipelotrichaceae bacterium]